MTITDESGTLGTVVQGHNPNLQSHLDVANEIYQRECDAWIYCVASVTVDRPELLTIRQNDCGFPHTTSDEEDDLFDLGRNMNADVVGYFITGDTAGFAGCAAHPAGRRGFWVGSLASPFTFAHELTHVIGGNSHVDDDENLMFTPTADIQNPPPNLSRGQCNSISADEDIERCERGIA
ncbi:hypothetical protein [Belnapia moabensis]|uniref:hypothetical protein n=1 Tax=Belnapia moabensis TaxID=365533 RepID=UPI0012ED35BF|nr:hypothetical protein [Belnapia moabensis]